MLGRSHSEVPDEEPRRFTPLHPSSPERLLVNGVNDRLASALGHESDRPESLTAKLIEATQHQIRLLELGGTIEARVSVDAYQTNVDELSQIAGAFGIELPEPGLAGLRQLLVGLRELGESRTMIEAPVKSWKEKRITSTDMIQVVVEPTIIESEDIGIEKLVIPSPVSDSVRLVFSGLGLTHPDNVAENPVILDLVIFPPSDEIRLT